MRERNYVREVLANEFRSSSGSLMTKKLEREFARKFGSSFAIAFCNGTATMHAALEAAGVGPGDEVIVPPLTMSATTFAVLQANATPIFADVDPDTFQIDVESVRCRLTAKTRAVIPVALYGMAADLVSLRRLCDENSLLLLEDNAECYLSSIDGKLVGTFGDAASYSFQSSKHITSGEGGVLLCNTESFADKVRKVQSLGYAGVSASAPKISKNDIQNPTYSRHVSLGWNYRLGELPAAVALAQTERMEKLVSVRIASGEFFNSAVRGFEHILKPQFVPEGFTHSYWTWAAKLNTDIISWLDFRNQFTHRGGDSFYSAWKLTYLEPMFSSLELLGRDKFIQGSILRSYKPGLCPVAENLQPRLVQLKTNYWNMRDAKRQARILRSLLSEIDSGK